MTFPIDRRDERSYPPGWRGEVFVCDVDRTYLATRFSSLSGMLRIPLEFAVDKREIAGMVPLLRELRRGPEAASRLTPLYFLSASPAQLRPVVERKMLLDGVEYDGTTFKDWLGVLRTLRPARLREQLGFKLTALLLGRRTLPPGASEVLIGDDLERDPLAFTLYADLLAGRLPPERVRRVLLQQGVADDDAEDILHLARQAVRPDAGGGVRRAYVRVERHASAEEFLDYRPHLVACRSALQMALTLWHADSISLAGVERVAQELQRRGELPRQLEEQLRDVVRRGLLPASAGAEARDRLAAVGLMSTRMTLPAGPDSTWASAAPPPPDSPWTPPRFLLGG